MTNAELIAAARWRAGVATHMLEGSGEHMTATCGACLAREDIPQLANALEASEAQAARLSEALHESERLRIPTCEAGGSGGAVMADFITDACSLFNRHQSCLSKACQCACHMEGRKGEVSTRPFGAPTATAQQSATPQSPFAATNGNGSPSAQWPADLLGAVRAFERSGRSQHASCESRCYWAEARAVLVRHGLLREAPHA